MGIEGIYDVLWKKWPRSSSRGPEGQRRLDRGVTTSVCSDAALIAFRVWSGDIQTETGHGLRRHPHMLSPVQPILHLRHFKKAVSHFQETLAFISAGVWILGFDRALHRPAPQRCCIGLMDDHGPLPARLTVRIMEACARESITALEVAHAGRGGRF